jgi:hypothetical protein
MRPQQLARTECANWQDGACAGIEEHHDKCLVADGEKCAYFEGSVLQLDALSKDDRYRQQIIEARIAYNGRAEARGRPCPDCGTPMRPRQRYCDECRKKRRREAARDGMREKRRGVNS